VGKIKEARALATNVIQIDPLTPMSRGGGIGLVDLVDGFFEQAAKNFYEWFRLETQNPGAVYFYALSLVYAGRSKEATKIIDQHIHMDHPDHFTKLGLLVKYAIEWDTEKIEHLVKGDFEKSLRSDPQNNYFASALFTLAGMKDKSLDFLEQAVNQGFINYPFMEVKDPILVSIRGEERFQKLMKRVKHEWENFDA
jgi:hypothetical protein